VECIAVVLTLQLYAKYNGQYHQIFSRCFSTPTVYLTTLTFLSQGPELVAVTRYRTGHESGADARLAAVQPCHYQGFSVCRYLRLVDWGKIYKPRTCVRVQQMRIIDHFIPCMILRIRHVGETTLPSINLPRAIGFLIQASCRTYLIPSRSFLGRSLRSCIRF
jgi:hypothetical protein